jgi:hypothetical protein
MKQKTAWKFLQWRDGKIVSHFDGSEWTIGKWRKVPAPVESCKGLNCSLLIEDARSYVVGNVLATVIYGGVVIKGDDKITCEKMKIVKAWHFTAPAWKAYEEAKATAWNAYQEAKATAWNAYEEAKAPAEKAYQEAKAPAEKAYEEATAPAEKAYQEAKATAWNKIIRTLARIK